MSCQEQHLSLTWLPGTDERLVEVLHKIEIPESLDLFISNYINY